jgi:hypothetical protein
MFACARWFSALLDRRRSRNVKVALSNARGVFSFVVVETLLGTDGQRPEKYAEIVSIAFYGFLSQ